MLAFGHAPPRRGSGSIPDRRSRLLCVTATSVPDLKVCHLFYSYDWVGSDTDEASQVQLVRAVANTNRGRRSSPSQRQQILQLVQELEDSNPTRYAGIDCYTFTTTPHNRRPVDSPLLSGRWSLLYQAPTREEDIENPDTTLEGPLLARLRPVFGGLIRSKVQATTTGKHTHTLLLLLLQGITQVIDRDGGVVENIASFSLLGDALQGELNIAGTCCPAPTDTQAVQVDVTFTAFTLRLGAARVTFPLEWASPQVVPCCCVNGVGIDNVWETQGWVRTTFLDEELRIGRGDKGSVFVTARQKA